MPALAKSSPQVDRPLAEELSQFVLQLSYDAIRPPFANAPSI